jgi:TonB-dependent receptor
MATRNAQNIALGGAANMRKPSWQQKKKGHFLEVSTGVAALICAVPAAHAQAPAAPAAEATPAAPAATTQELETVVVRGTREAQRTSIERKKKAATAVDSIAAEDVGKFPDQNVNEAISRVAGVALDRGDNGEGVGISVRGTTADMTRVDIDGMTVLNTNGSLANGLNAGGGRVADLRELPSAIVKTIDVYKGTTAAMTEGSLAGSVHIETRNGLDFDKPFLQFATDGQQNSITEKLTPSGSAIFANKFMDDRLGIFASVNYSKFETQTDLQQPQTSGNAGPFRNADFDQSPEKTFTYDPSIVDPTATAGNMRVLGTGGVPIYASLSPIDILTRSAAAATPAACLAAFPALTQAQLNAIPAGDQVLGSVATSAVSAANNRTAAQLEQTNGLQTCLNQWNDYAPSLIRSLPRRGEEERYSGQFRVDYRLNDDLVVYATYQRADRHGSNVDNTLNLGSPAYNQTPASFTQAAPAATSNALVTPRTVFTGLGFSFNNTGLCGAPIVAGTGTAQTTTGCGVASDMTNVVVDDSHHVTSFHLNDGNANIDAINYDTDIETWNWQTGLHFDRDNFKVDLMYGDSGSTYQRAQLRTAVNYTYGGVDAHITPSGLWSYTLPAGLDLATLPYAALNPVIARNVSNASNVQAASPAYTAAQAAQWGSNFTVTWRPAMSDDSEQQAKMDFTWDVSEKAPFLTHIQTGYQRRDREGNGWGGGGYTVKPGTGNVGAVGYVAPVVVPTENLTVNFRSCMPTATSTQPCQYGFVPGTTVGTNNSPVANLNNTLFGTMTFTPGELDALISSALYMKDYPFLGDYPDKGDVMTNWPYINPAIIAAGIPGQVFDYSCMKKCMANDGNVYEQQHFAYNEVTDALYFMFDFEQELPGNMLFNGNIGTRLVMTDTTATGFMTLAHTAVATGYNPITNPNAVVTTTVAMNTSLQDDSRNWLPAGNFNFWFTPEVVLRYYQGKVMSRPPAANLLPSGTCTIDDRNNADVNGNSDLSNTCTGRVGNPGLKPFEGDNKNLTLEWYPTADLMFAVAHYRNKIITGAPINANMPASNLFAGNETALDPVTGKPFSDVSFTYPSYINGPSGTQLGMEYTAKVAFTFLPWIFRHTGVDLNYSELDFEDFATSKDLMTGAYNPPEKQRSYFKNFTLWYDDSRFTARVSYQGQSEFFDFISSCSNAINNYPTSFGQCPGQTIRTPYNPGGTNYRDATEFIDLKLSYQFNEHWNAYVSGRNVTRELTYRTVQPHNTYSDGAPTLEQMSYGGARWQVGLSWQY